jgi:hypothetical protein
MPCVICNNAKTVRSHLLPRAFAHDARAGQKELRVGTRGEPGFSLTQSGYFDNDILCEAHEKALQLFDEYGVNFVREFRQKRRVQIIKGERYWYIQNIDSDLLVRFAASIVWRWSVSRLSIARDVNLGGQEKTFRAVVFEGADCTQEPQVGLYSMDSRTLGSEAVCRLIMVPSDVLSKGVRNWGFAVGGVSFIVKADKRPVPLEAGRLLSVNGKVAYAGRESMIEDGPEYAAVAQTILDMGKRKPRPVPSRPG